MRCHDESAELDVRDIAEREQSLDRNAAVVQRALDGRNADAELIGNIGIA
jgi:hypothetical protein